MPDLPSGTVTFLFTDIEGSTKLWEQFPDLMRSALSRHDTVMHTAIAQHNGHVFKTIGDAFCAAFSTTSDALSAALAAQQALISEPWPEPIIIRVRMALHTGAVEARDNDYFGQPLNRVARLLSTGHGGQVLLSGVTSDLVRDTLPASVTLLAMGEHRLRDLNCPETVFQLLHPDLPADFPPLKSLDYLPNNLPLQLTSFIGREKEMAEITALLSKTRLLTLTGSGGAGKTRLSLQMAGEMLDQFPDGVWLVELAPLSHPTLVPQTLASTLNLTEQAGKSYTQVLIDYLPSKHLLLLLDNCEHLLNACAQLSDRLLRTCPNLKILASSREALGIAGEQTYRVPSLSLPDPKLALTLANVRQYEAIRLFIERAASSRADFVLIPQNVSTLAKLCHRLDGIPLAIELAAARVRVLPIEEINTRLDNRFRLLTGGSKTALPRHQTLRALIDWSYDLLSPQEKILLAHLSVFAGGWTLEAAEQVASGESAGEGSIEDWQVLDLLTSLVDKSLVLYEEREGKARYRLLESVRQYALDRFLERGDRTTIRFRHRDYFLGLAEKVTPLLTGSDQAHWLNVLEAEHDNLRQALAFCLEEGQEGEAGLRLAAALQRFWWTRGHLSEGRQHLTGLLARPAGPEPSKARANALSAAGTLSAMQGDYAAARSLQEESLALFRQLEEKRGIANCLNALGIMTMEQGDYPGAHALLAECLAIRRELADKVGLAFCLNNQGLVAYFQRDYAASRTYYEECLPLLRELGEQAGIAACLSNLGIVAQEQGDYPVARSLQEESLAIRRALGEKGGIANCLSNLGVVAQKQGDYAVARTLQKESLIIYRELGEKRGIANCQGNLGIVAMEQGDYPGAHCLLAENLAIRLELGDKAGIAEDLDTSSSLAQQEQRMDRAARLWGAIASLREAIGSPRTPIDQEKYEQELAQARSALGETTFTAAFEEGQAMTLEQAVEYALEEDGHV